MNDSEFVYLELLRRFEKSKPIFFLGAGMSFHSGIPLVNTLYKKLWQSAEIEIEYEEFINSQKFSFEFFFKILSETCEVDTLLDIFKSDKLSRVHTLLTLLAKEGYSNNFITTNFDILIEKALVNDFRTFKEDNVNEVDFQTEEINIIKLHGCITNPERLKITINDVASNSNQALVEKFFDKLGQQMPEREIIFWGYSFSDYFDIVPALFRHIEKHKITVIQHGNKESDFPDLPFSSHGNISANAHVYKINSDKFVDFSLDHYKLEHQCDKEFNWEYHFDKWLAETRDKKIIGIQNAIAKIIMYQGNFKLSNSILRNTIKHSKKIQSTKLLLATLTTKSANYFQLGSYLKCLITTRQIIKLADTSNYQYPYELSSAYLNYAAVLIEKRQYLQALKFSYMSLNICTKHDFTHRFFDNYSNMGIILSELNCDSVAKKYIQKAIEYSRSNGDYPSLCRRLGYLAEVQLKTGHLNEAIENIDEAISISVMVGEKSRQKYLFGVKRRIENYR